MSQEQLQHLTAACKPASFGFGDKDVIDPSYRTAGKLDDRHFAMNVDLERAGVLNAVRYDLLGGEACAKPIRAERYKLNVYGMPTISSLYFIVSSSCREGIILQTTQRYSSQ